MFARIKDILQCIICLEIVGCPAVQCQDGHLMCCRCRENLPENTCPTCRQTLITVRNLAVEQVVETLPKECPYTDYGCQELADADEVDAHRVTCSFRQFSCPHPPCTWVGYKPEVDVHMRDKHPQHIISSNKQAVKVPAVWEEASSWTMFLNDEILVLKCRLEQATSFLFGSFKCLGSLIPIDSFMYYITVKKGGSKTTVSGSISSDRSGTTVQCDEEWNIVFPRSSFDIDLESGSSSNEFVLLDVEVKDNRREGAGQEVGEVVEQALQCEVRDEGGASTTAQEGGNNQLDETADRVIQKLSDWISSEKVDFLEDFFRPIIFKIRSIVTETSANIINDIQKPFIDMASLNVTEWLDTSLYMTNFHVHYSRNFAEKQIKSERLIAARGGSVGWMDYYFRIWSQVVSEAYYENMLKYNPSLDIDERELEKLVTARERRLRDECAQRLLWRAHQAGGHREVKNIIIRIGILSGESDEEIASLLDHATKISWSNMTLPNTSSF